MARVRQQGARGGARRAGSAARALQDGVHLRVEPRRVRHDPHGQPRRARVAQAPAHRQQVEPDPRAAALLNLRLAARPHRQARRDGRRARGGARGARHPARAVGRVHRRAEDRRREPLRRHRPAGRLAPDHRPAPPLPEPAQRHALLRLQPRELDRGRAARHDRGAAEPRPRRRPVEDGPVTALHPHRGRHPRLRHRAVRRVPHLRARRHPRHAQRRHRSRRGLVRRRGRLPAAHQEDPQEAAAPEPRAP